MYVEQFLALGKLLGYHPIAVRVLAVLLIVAIINKYLDFARSIARIHCLTEYAHCTKYGRRAESTDLRF